MWVFGSRLAGVVTRGRPAAGARDDTRERILEAAVPLFAAEGFAGTSTRAIAQAAGVNIATLAYHFGDKEGLYAALVDRVYARVLAVEVPTEVGPDRRERLRATVRAIYGFARENQAELRVLLRHVLDSRRLPRAVSERWLGPMLARVGEVLAPLDVELDPPKMLALLSLNHLVVRYAVSEAEDLTVFGAGGDPHAAVAEHLADVACAMLL